MLDGIESNTIYRLIQTRKNLETGENTFMACLLESSLKLELVRVNKFLINSRFEMCKLEITSTRRSNRSASEINASIWSIECFKNSEKLLKNWRADYSALSHELTSSCDFLNLYLSTRLLEPLLDFLNIIQSRKSSSLALKVNVNHQNNYLNLVDEDSAEQLTVGARVIESETSQRRCLRLSLQNLVVFRSSCRPNSLFRADLVELLRRINEDKFEGRDDSRFTHIWGNLLNVNELKLSLRTGHSAKLFVDRLFMEYSPILLDRLVDRLKSILLQRTPSSSYVAKRISLSIKLNQVNVYFLFERTYFVYACLNRFSLMTRPATSGNGRSATKESFHLKLDQTNCSLFRLDELENRFVRLIFKEIAYYFVQIVCYASKIYR